MRERSHESSPAMGGVIIGAVMMLSLVYALGYGPQAAALAGGTLGHLLDLLSQGMAAAADTIRSAS